MWETGVVSICLGGDGGGRRGDAGAPARSPFSTSSSSSISIYLPALLHLPLFPPTPTRSTHHPQLNGWLTQGLLGYMLRVFPHTDAHRHVCTCVPGRKWWAPLAIFVLSICYHSPPYVRPPRLAKLPPFLLLPLLLFLFSSSSFAPHVYVYVHVSLSHFVFLKCVCVCMYVCMYVTASSSMYMRSSSGICSELGSLPFSSYSLVLSPSILLLRGTSNFRIKKKGYTFLLCLPRKSIHTHHGRYRTRVCPRVTASGEQKGRRESKEKGFMEESVAARAHAGRRNARIRTALVESTAN